ncbi:MAG: helix-turn-helix transcriptional regulator [Bacteroidales bacterium]|nr:helix-turn-helix transcriptional regulator [Bacteroidales bacterium]
MAQKKLRRREAWISMAKSEIEHEEELLACRLIVLKIIRFMKDNHLSQKELAQKLGVSPQYINKFLNGLDLDMKISTAIRYGKILGIKLIEIPEDKTTNSREMVFAGTYVDKMPFVNTYKFDYDWNTATIHFGYTEGATFNTRKSKEQFA